MRPPVKLRISQHWEHEIVRVRVSCPECFASTWVVWRQFFKKIGTKCIYFVFFYWIPHRHSRRRDSRLAWRTEGEDGQLWSQLTRSRITEAHASTSYVTFIFDIVFGGGNLPPAKHPQVAVFHHRGIANVYLVVQQPARSDKNTHNKIVCHFRFAAREISIVIIYRSGKLLLQSYTETKSTIHRPAIFTSLSVSGVKYEQSVCSLSSSIKTRNAIWWTLICTRSITSHRINCWNAQRLSSCERCRSCWNLKQTNCLRNQLTLNFHWDVSQITNILFVILINSSDGKSNRARTTPLQRRDEVSIDHRRKWASFATLPAFQQNLDLETSFHHVASKNWKRISLQISLEHWRDVAAVILMGCCRLVKTWSPARLKCHISLWFLFFSFVFRTGLDKEQSRVPQTVLKTVQTEQSWRESASVSLHQAVEKLAARQFIFRVRTTEEEAALRFPSERNGMKTEIHHLSSQKEKAAPAQAKNCPCIFLLCVKTLSPPCVLPLFLLPPRKSTSSERICSSQNPHTSVLRQWALKALSVTDTIRLAMESYLMVSDPSNSNATFSRQQCLLSLDPEVKSTWLCAFLLMKDTFVSHLLFLYSYYLQTWPLTPTKSPHEWNSYGSRITAQLWRSSEHRLP